jgi:hypothetical protein
MTKAELFEAMRDVPDDAEVFVFDGTDGPFRADRVERGFSVRYGDVVWGFSTEGREMGDGETQIDAVLIR